MAATYRAVQVGSLLRPPELVEARWAYYDRRMTEEEYDRLADLAIPKVLQYAKGRRSGHIHRWRIPAHMVGRIACGSESNVIVRSTSELHLLRAVSIRHA